MKYFSLFISFVLLQYNLHSQCADGQVALTMNIAVDSWPWETYWQIVPSGNDCGEGIVAEGSNPQVGCDNTAAGESEYPANTIQTVGPFCLTEGESYDLIFNDSWGDGGLGFELIQNNVTTNIFWAVGFDSQWTFTAGEFNVGENDSPCSAIEVPVNGSVVALNNELAIASLLEPHPAGGNCNALGLWCESDGNATNTVWAYFIAEEGESYEITTCNLQGSFDTQLAVYHATNCADFSTFEMISSNDDMIGGCSVTSAFASTCYASCLIPGDTYFIQIDGWAGELGDVHLSVFSYEGDIELSGVVNNVPCPLEKGQNANGSIIPFVIGEGLNFSCQWNGPAGFESDENAIYNLQPGVYELTLTTPCGEVLEESYEVFLPQPWSFSANAIGPDCPESGNGSINITVSGATQPYQYAWSAFNFSSNQQDISNLDYGFYSLTITDANGCEYFYNNNLQAEDNFQFDLGNDTTLCHNESLLVYGPPGLEYLWQDGSTNQFYMINGNQWPAGTNALILTANTDDGCSYTDAFLFDIEICNDIVELAPQWVFDLYPNPINNQLNIACHGFPSKYSIKIFDAAGRLIVDSTGQGDMQLPFGFDAGLYQCYISTDHSIQSFSLMKQ